VRLLGRTGAPRAQAVLLPLVKGKATPLRLAALEALGSLRLGAPLPAPAAPRPAPSAAQASAARKPSAVDAALLEALDDEAPEVRLRAAAALGRVASPGAAATLLRRLAVAAEQDRGALGIALSGALARSSDPALAHEVAAAVASAPESARDALIEGLGRMRGQGAGDALARLAAGTIDDRRKVAEALAGHPEAHAALRKLAADADPGVRANAVWSIGGVLGKDALPLLEPLLRDPDVAVAGNAAAAIGRVAGRAGDGAAAAALLCRALGDGRPYVRANALSGLSVAGARCDGGAARDLLGRDPAEAVRLAAADHLGRGLLAAPGKGGGDKDREADARALTRCASEDRNATVALRCAHPAKTPSGTDDVAVYVIPDGSQNPVPRAPFALVRADGLMRLGVADRRGELFEASAPRGPIRLAVPAPLAR
jgi:HEAT repeat protein